MENNNSDNQKQTLGSSTTILVLGILSIFPGIACVGIVGVVLGIIALVKAKKILIEIQDNPNKYTESSIKVFRAGRVCAIVGLSISSCYFAFWLIYFGILGLVLGGVGSNFSM